MLSVVVYSSLRHFLAPSFRLLELTLFLSRRRRGCTMGCCSRIIVTALLVVAVYLCPSVFGQTPPPFNLKADQPDHAGFPLNPKWTGQTSNSTPPDPKPCLEAGSFNSSSCSTDTISLDTLGATADGFSGHCVAGSKIPGHVNWFPATYTGKIRWDEYSGGQVASSGDAGGLLGLLTGGACILACPACAWECAAAGGTADAGVTALGPYGNDQDYNFVLETDAGAGLTLFNGSGNANENKDGKRRIGLEFNSNESIDHFTSPFWRRFRDAVQHDDQTAHDMMRDRQAIVTGLMGLDCEHDCPSELHPVYAMAVEVNPDPTNNQWAFFARNFGNEGGCSRNLPHPLFDDPSISAGAFVFDLPLKAGFRLLGHSFGSIDNALGQNTQVAFADDKAQLQITGVPNGRTSPGFLDGDITLTWERRIPPTVTKVEPNNTPVGSGKTVTVTGANFTDVQYVNPATAFNINSPTQITASIPDTLASGPYQVRVETLGSSSAEPVFFYVTPIVTAINPVSGPFSGNTSVTVSGTGFTLPTFGTFIPTTFFAAFANSSTRARLWSDCHNSSECEVATTPSAPGNIADIIACVGDACSATSAADHFTYTGPTITSFAPSRGPLTGGTWVEIKGTNLVHDGTIQLAFGGVTVQRTDGCPISSTDSCINALTPVAASAGPVALTATVQGYTVTAPGSFTYLAHSSLTTIGYDASGVDDPPGWLELDGSAPPGGAAVSLTSSDPVAVLPPSSITVPAGSQFGHFTLTFPPIDRNGTAHITAAYENSSVGMDVKFSAHAAPPPPPPISISAGIDSLGYHDSADETVTLTTAAPPTGAVITLSSSDPAAIKVPPSATIPAGGFKTTFRITNEYNGTRKNIHITATYNGVSALDSLFVPRRHCPPRTCQPQFAWNPVTCACEAK
jgi:hypothetical protein